MHTAAITRKTNRRKNDAYFTPTSAVDCLLRHVEITGTVLECCAGGGAIANVFKDRNLKVIETDISNNPLNDATTEEYWLRINRYQADWVVTNPPFNNASKIVPLAYNHTNIGIAFLLRLSYLEPCFDRGQWLSEHEVNKLIIMPRISFTGNGKVDSCTTAWMVWHKYDTTSKVIVVPKA